MARVLNSFKVRFGDKTLDYRLGENLDLLKIKSFFQERYKFTKLWKGPRHILGILTKSSNTYFLKLSTSEGISVITKNEYYWNNYFNNYSLKKAYLVPKNYDSGLYKDKYFYLITSYFNGELLCKTRSSYNKASKLEGYIPQIIEFSEIIQQLPQSGFGGDAFKEAEYQIRFLSKVRNWFGDIPVDIAGKFNVRILLEIVENGVSELLERPRHGDFAPWHIIKLAGKNLGLIDGEHALVQSVEGYDICYFIQRVFSVLKNPSIARMIYLELLKRGYIKDKLKTVLAARSIGGFLDESLTDRPNYEYAKSFMDWVVNT